MTQSTKMLEKKFKNVNVIIPSENLGYAKAFNLAFKKCKNKYTGLAFKVGLMEYKITKCGNTVILSH